MEAVAALEPSLLNRSAFRVLRSRRFGISATISARSLRYAAKSAGSGSYTVPYASRISFNSELRSSRLALSPLSVSRSCACRNVEDGVTNVNVGLVEVLVKRGLILVALVCGVFVFGCRRVLAVEEVVSAGYGALEQTLVALRNSWPKVLQVLRVFKEQGLVLALLLGLSAFFSMAETSITTLWPWKVANSTSKLLCVCVCFVFDNLELISCLPYCCN